MVELRLIVLVNNFATRYVRKMNKKQKNLFFKKGLYDGRSFIDEGHYLVLWKFETRITMAEHANFKAWNFN